MYRQAVRLAVDVDRFSRLANDKNDLIGASWPRHYAAFNLEPQQGDCSGNDALVKQGWHS